jgi:hypothetical protein
VAWLNSNLLFSNFNVFFLGIVFFALIMDAALTTAKAWKYGKNQE